MTVRELLRRTEGRLRREAVDSPALSARLLLEHGLDKDQTSLILSYDEPVSPEAVAMVERLTRRRAAGEPAAYILGVREFYGLEFRVTPDTLIPRPETEHIVEEAVARYGDTESVAFADLGTGSGCLAVALAVSLSGSMGIAVDLSSEALKVSAANAVMHNVADRLLFARADFGALPLAEGALDLVAANPPYIPEAEYLSLHREVRDHEPAAALTPGPQGVEAIQCIVPEAARCLKSSGVLLMEMAWDQGAEVQTILNAAGNWKDVRVLRDLAGHERVVAAMRK